MYSKILIYLIYGVQCVRGRPRGPPEGAQQRLRRRSGGARRAAAETGIEVRLIITALRSHSLEENRNLATAAVASVSGGTLRNVFLGLKPVWISDPWITVAVLSAVLITLVFRRVTRIGKTLLVMDTFGLAIATISGSYLAFKQEVSWLAAIILGVITAVTGGLLRDVLCQVEPVLLHRETIGTSSL